MAQQELNKTTIIQKKLEELANTLEQRIRETGSELADYKILKARSRNIWEYDNQIGYARGKNLAYYIALGEIYEIIDEFKEDKDNA